MVYKGGDLYGAATDVVTKAFQGNEDFTAEDVEYLLAATFKIELLGVDVSHLNQVQEADKLMGAGGHDYTNTSVAYQMKSSSSTLSKGGSSLFS